MDALPLNECVHLGPTRGMADWHVVQVDNLCPQHRSDPLSGEFYAPTVESVIDHAGTTTLGPLSSPNSVWNNFDVEPQFEGRMTVASLQDLAGNRQRAIPRLRFDLLFRLDLTCWPEHEALIRSHRSLRDPVHD